MGKTTMLELLEQVSNTVKDYWEKDGNGLSDIKADKTNEYADKIIELMDKATYDDEFIGHTQEEIASFIGISASALSKFRNTGKNIGKKNLKKIVDAILIRLSTEGNLADDKMEEQVGELLFCIFRREEVKKIVKHFKIQPEDNWDNTVERQNRGYSHVLQVETTFGYHEVIQDSISYEDYFIDSGIMEEEMSFYKDDDILFNDYRTEDGSKSHIVIFDVRWIHREYLHQRIRCLQRKDNVFAVLMVEKGACCDNIDFYRDEHSNIMLIEYKEVREEDSESCSYNYLRSFCLSWYNDACKKFMMEDLGLPEFVK
jgi:transcriptional regulator with XRE-family HTH domain